MYIVFLYIVFLFSLYVFNFNKKDMITKSCNFLNQLLLSEWYNAKQDVINQASFYIEMLYLDNVPEAKDFVYVYKFKEMLSCKLITANNFESVLRLGIVSHLVSQCKNAR